MDITADLRPEDVKPAASRLYDQRFREFGKDDPGNVGCLPSGTRHILGGLTAGRVRIVQTPLLIAMLFEDLAHRQIHLDGRQLPDDPNPSFMGYPLAAGRVTRSSSRQAASTDGRGWTLEDTSY